MYYVLNYVLYKCKTAQCLNSCLRTLSSPLPVETYKATTVNLIVVLDEKSKDHQSQITPQVTMNV